MERIEDIDRLRAVAVIGTVYSHIPELWLWKVDGLEFFRSFSSGYAGVLLFFVISGFVISRSLIPKFDSADINSEKIFVIKEFFIKRFFRITPLATFWIIASLMVFHYTDPSLTEGNAYAALASAFNFYNIYTYIGGMPSNQYGIYWTLSFEEQFYLLLPLILLLAPSTRKRKVVLLSLGVINVIITSIISNPFPFLTIMSGVMLFYYSETNQYEANISKISNSITYKKALKVGSLLGIILLFSLQNIQQHFDLNSGLYLILTSSVFLCLVYIACLNENLVLNIKYLNIITNWIGTRSFSIYLCHYPVLVLLRKQLMINNSISWLSYSPDFTLEIFLMYILLVALISELSFQVIEKKGISLGRHYLNSKKINKLNSAS